MQGKTDFVGQLSNHNRTRIYSGGGLAPTLAARDYKLPVLVLVEVKKRNETKTFSSVRRENRRRGPDL